MKKIHVFLRHCYYSKLQECRSRERPEWFDKQKVFENFKKTIDPDLADYTIVYDEKYGSIQDTFLKDEKKVEVINYGYEAGSFSRMVDLAAGIDADEDTVIYFLEDDYIHRPGWCNVLLEGFNLAPYVTLYDHADKYFDAGYDNLLSKVMVTESVHWRTVPSTCNTYACTLKTLREDYGIHKYYSDISFQSHLPPGELINGHPNGQSWDHAKFVHLENSGKRLISSIPGYSTHCAPFYSPTIDWEKYI